MEVKTFFEDSRSQNLCPLLSGEGKSHLKAVEGLKQLLSEEEYGANVGTNRQTPQGCHCFVVSSVAAESSPTSS